MCLLAFSWKSHPRYRFIFAGNRDEFHARPAAPAGWWDDAPSVLGGRDLEAGGGWLGVNRDGRFAVVTNFREPDLRPVGKRSRGELVNAFLAGTRGAADYLHDIEEQAGRFAGFNLLFGNVLRDEALFYFSNRDGLAADERTVSPGIHALSNHLLDTPWPKVQRLRQRFTNELDREQPRMQALLEFLDDTEPVRDEELPSTGISPEWERRLSAARIIGGEYGTRASTVIAVDYNGVCEFIERRFSPDGSIAGETRERFEAG